MLVRSSVAKASEYCLCLVVIAIGCSDRSGSSARFVPKPGVAEDALRQALVAWQNGDAAGALASSTPRVQVSDTHRKPEQRLEQFEILGEVGGDAGRCFSVRLVLSNPADEQKARYIVVGIDPVWVFREEDYTMLSHWEHPMQAAVNADEKEKAQKRK